MLKRSKGNTRNNKDPEIKIGGWHIATKKLKFEDISAESTDLDSGFKALQGMSASLMAITKENGEKKAKLIKCDKPDLQSHHGAFH